MGHVRPSGYPLQRGDSFEKIDADDLEMRFSELAVMCRM